ncbi:gamma-glutamylcyclotransferase family protein [Parasedimentitalea psychrophila]|uniref:Gamma-glutamylcyclotransferase family protein n=1 Tax=Parasedimentitalea psychrophila TaxID=2997337 RepID=A0A9Y2L4P9_9RHOB|nr:gamma-glutamylcyclotransferase family protein [Parasedimentitalea psychrophila]WIY27552.1 gamma-glutamylcyclotransferase family protein [Parasedimentitalea psychrophila]
MSPPYFFGYGSLVNLGTHAYHDPQPARLSGWRRAWVHTELREVAFLSAVPCAGSEIDGLIAAVPGADWDALDGREYAYDRLPLLGAVAHGLRPAPEISLYAVPRSAQMPGSARHPILLSYLDVVVQGYDQVFGVAGVAAFFASTDGWEAPILNDRAAPIYPRHQLLEVAQRELVDHHLDAIGAKVIVVG